MTSLAENNNDLSHEMEVFENPKNNNILKETCDDISKVNQINEIWTKSNFGSRENQKPQLKLDIKDPIMSWTCTDPKDFEDSSEDTSKDEKMPEVKTPTMSDQELPSPSHHARRPMNAFLIFCKKHRSIVRKKFPNLENRGVTRILGEWWALLDAKDKDAYTNLAKEYKDAFFCANPNFKWYKLPAPPLRTLPVRPVGIQQETSPPLSPSANFSTKPEFTPGKLADESQLGMLSSLLNTSQNQNTKSTESSTKNIICNNNNNQIQNHNSDFFNFSSPLAINVNNELPPKPIKKRFTENLSESKKCISRNLFDDEETTEMNKNINMTNQQIVNKVVDSQFVEDTDDRVNYKDTRKSVRKCKGNRYAEFMSNGKLLKSKREKRDTIFHIPETQKLNLDSTIKRLEERIQPRINDELEHTGTPSEILDNDECTKSIPTFNLDERIDALPCLSYDVYWQRKRESKKRKFIRSKNETQKVQILEKQKQLIGSKKRKNKNNITHLEQNNNPVDLSGLTTLAEIAAKTEKIIEGA